MKIRILTEYIQGLGLGHVARCFNLSVVFLEMGYEVDFFVRGDGDFSGFLETQIGANFNNKDSINEAKFNNTDSINIESRDSTRIESNSTDSIEFKTKDFINHTESNKKDFTNNTKDSINKADFNITDSVSIESSPKDSTHRESSTDFINTESNTTDSIKNAKSSPKDSINTESNTTIFTHFYPLTLQWENIRHKSLLTSDICIIDSYHLSEFIEFFYSCVETCRVVCLFDDDGLYLELFKQNIPNLFILNQNGFYNLKHFTSPKVFSGLQYALLNKCFLYPINVSKKYDFFVCFGGEDRNDVSFSVTQRLIGFGFSVCVVLGERYNGQLLSLKNTDSISIFQNITQEKIATLMAESKACVVSGGGIIFEAISACECVFGLNLADNQNAQIEILKSQNLIKELSLNFSKSDVKRFKSADSINIGQGVSEFASALCMSAINSALKIARETKSKDFNVSGARAINFCNLSGSEALRVLTYRNHPFVSKNMYGSAKISVKKHFDFLATLSEDECNKYFLVQKEISGKCVDIGVVNLTRINPRHKNAYFGIYKNPFLKESLGEILMEVIKFIAFKEYNLNMLYLEVLETNKAAIKLYEKMGFKLCGKLNECFKKDNHTFKNILIYELKSPTII